MYVPNNFLICVHIKINVNYEHNLKFLIMKGHTEVY